MTEEMHQYKSRLQELCQKKSWSNPEYTSLKEGPSHNPRFKSSVNVNGITFQSPVFSKHIKQSQSEAAKIAYTHFTAAVPAPLSPAATSNTIATGIALGLVDRPGALDHNLHASLDADTRLEVKHLYKTQLQVYAQKRNLGLPDYFCKREGPPHNCRFTCSVSVAENTYQCHQSFLTMKDAEHAAAKLALTSLAPSDPEVQNESTIVYKNLLQELAQKQGFGLPTYSTKSGGLPHSPTFLSIVEVKGETFQGEEAKTRKQAEMNAAKAAYVCLEQRSTSNSQMSIPTGCQSMEVGCSSKSTSMVDSQENTIQKPLSCIGVVPDREMNHVPAGDVKPSVKKLASNDEASLPNICDGSDSRRKRDASQIPHSSQKGSCPSLPSSSEGSNYDSVLINNIKLDEQTETENMAPRKKVCILSRKLNVQHPRGVEVCSDNNWIAIETTPDENAS